MNRNAQYFFCGIGGSGMLPLALIMKGLGYAVEGSDRALDQGRLGAKFDYLARQGIRLHPQDGSGIRDKSQVLVTSAAVEDTIPDVRAARGLGLTEARRANLLAALFNQSPLAIAVGGTSGKSTTTAMAGWILHACGKAPTIMNGAVMKNFADAANPFVSSTTGKGEAFVSEVDESDGSIALYRPSIAVLTNISLDHKPLPELRALFGAFIACAGTAILNLDDAETAALAARAGNARTFSLGSSSADFRADAIALEPLVSHFTIHEQATGNTARCTLNLPGRHNVANAVAAVAAAVAAGIPLAQACAALAGFAGIKRRFEIVGTTRGITVIDDFAHNPDKITATLETLHAFPGRVIVLFQPHGYGPLRLMGRELVETFATRMRSQDILVMPDPAYYGGTTNREVSSSDIVDAILARGRKAIYHELRKDCIPVIGHEARPGDRIIIMGARDDTLSEFAAEVLAALS
ncbi:MAG: glutamate ligase domain-containing protein [Alphaproteobacteria bacterium]